MAAFPQAVVSFLEGAGSDSDRQRQKQQRAIGHRSIDWSVGSREEQG